MTHDRRDEEIDALLDAASSGIRSSALPSEAAETAAARVRAGLDASATAATEGDTPMLSGCAAYQALMPAALRGELPAGRRLLVEQHTRECVACRRQWIDLREGRTAEPAAARAATGRGRWRSWALAAAIVLPLAGLSVLVAQKSLVARTPRTASVLRADGMLFRVGAEQSVPLAVNQTLHYGDGVRTTKDAGAVLRLPDGTQVEMRERTELTLASRGRDTDVRLARGAIIVQAAPQGAGHLFVTTDDCRVAVTGTVFAVDQGTKGARVSVLRGEVRVASIGGAETVLKPGDQFASNDSVGRTAIASEIAWSHDRSRYDAVLAELASLQKDIERLPQPALRRSTRLLDLAPANTVVFVALPNVGDTAAEAHRLLTEHLSASEPLRAWWNERVGPQKEQELERTIAAIRQLGDQLGDEIALALPAGAGPQDNLVVGVVGLASVKDAARFRSVVEEELARAKATAGAHDAELRFVDDPAAPAPAGTRHALELWLHGDLLVAASSRPLLAEVAARADHASGPFVGTPFHDRLAGIYADGVKWLAAADLGRLLGAVEARAQATEHGAPTDALRRAGLMDARYVFVQSTGENDKATFEASLEFAGPRRGVASWLAAPAPMGSLAFVSPDANAVAAVVVKDPATLLDDVFAMAGDKAPEVRAALDQARARLGADIRTDVLATLGGEVAFALDGPVLPTPAWKAIIEVYDPARLQRTIETVVRQAGAELAFRGSTAQIQLTTDEADGRTFHSVGMQNGPSVHYTFSDGYLIVAPQRALLERALQNRKAGLSVTSSPTFRALLPKDHEANFSAILFRDMSSVVHAAGAVVPGVIGSPAPGGNPLVALFASAQPGLEYIYAEEDRITAAANGGRLSGLALMSLLGLAEGHGPHGPHAIHATPVAPTLDDGT